MDRSTLLALGAMALAILVVANDFTALNLALPDMERDFDSQISTMQWVVNGYALVFGVLIVTGGRLADMFGRRRIFFIGAAIFAFFSALGGAAQSDAWLIACRAAMGVGGAMIWPAVLGMVYAALPEDKAGFAGGFLLGVAGLGNAIGPLVGGGLTDALSWRWVFFVNVPIAALAIFATWRAIHQPVEPTRERIDYAGIVTLSLGLVALLVALDEATSLGWTDWRIVALFAASALLIAVFVVVERRAGEGGLVPPSVIRNREFAMASLAVLMMSAIFFAALLYAPQFQIKILGYSPFKAGAGMLPMMATFGVVAFFAGQFYGKLPPKLILAVGTVCLTAGTFLLSTVSDDSGYAALAPGLAIIGFGVGTFYPTITTAGVTALYESKASLAGGIVYMAQVAGGAVGLGLTTTIFTSRSQDELSEEIPRTGAALTGREEDAVHGILSGTESAEAALRGLSDPVASRVEELVRDSFVAGVDTAFKVDAAIALVGVLIVVLFVGGRLRIPTDTHRLHVRRAHG